MKPFKNNPETMNLEAIVTIELVPDEQDYQEKIVDARIKWISENDPHSSLKNFNMVDCQSEIDFFMSRKQELEQQRDQQIHQRMLQLKQEVQAIQTAEPPELAISFVGPDHVIQERIEKYRRQEISIREANCQEEVQLIAGRYNSLKQQCEEHINQARASYQDYFRIWQEERSWGMGNGDSWQGSRGAGGQGRQGRQGG